MAKSMLSISRAMSRRSMRLLDMEYKPSEIASELSVRQDWVLLTIKHGAPARKDESGRYWIHGEKFAAWLWSYTAQEKERARIKPTECYCVGCKKIVEFKADKSLSGKKVGNRLLGNRVIGKCPKGHKVSKFLGKEKPK